MFPEISATVTERNNKMGDIADYMIDQMIERSMWGRAQPRSAAKKITCQHCGERGLEWGHDGRRWYLVDRDCNPHKCDMSKVAADDFEALP